ncbi:MAG: hypothetical protein NXI24_09155 [bacterium]|nr:hypothetical protein [bacterium]
MNMALLFFGSAAVAFIGMLWTIRLAIQNEDGGMWVFGILFVPIYCVPRYAFLDIKSRWMPLIVYSIGMAGIFWAMKLFLE